MARIRSRSSIRAGFTLIEMLIVLGIIILLASLLLAAVMKVMATVPEVQTRVEIGELEVALGNFMAEYNLSDPPPSFLILNENMSLYGSTPIEQQSKAFLLKTFGRSLGTGTTFIDWNGDGIPNGPWFLEGEQCLVFYLGGIPNTKAMATGADPSCQGFSANNNNPADTTPASMTGVRRKGPYYPFVTNRLMPLTSVPNLPNVSKTASAFFVYMDPWKAKFSLPNYGGAKPYAYFSTSGYNNAYNPNAASLTALGLTGECSSLQTGPAPATIPLPWHTVAATATTGATYVNPNKFQILSAGRDGFWGDGDYSGGSAAANLGRDDQANFSSRILGANQQ